MIIKLALLDRDENYLNRLTNAFMTKYSDKFEIHAFTELEYALGCVVQSKIDVFVAGGDFDINVDALPERCGFAYFSPDSSIEEINGQCAISKYQKVDQIYKQILSIFSEHAGNLSGFGTDDGSTKVAVFSSPCGGAGNSTLAAACAVHFAKLGKKVLYLNFEKFGSSDTFFSAPGQFDMSDVVFALKSSKANLSMKLESCVKQDNSGVYFYSPTKLALDMMELNYADMTRVVTSIKSSGLYDYVIIDIDFVFNQEAFKFYELAYSLVWCGSGSDIDNSKITRAYQALEIVDRNGDGKLCSRISVIYNKHGKYSKPIQIEGLTNLGIIPFNEATDAVSAATKFATLDIYDKIFR